MHVAFESKQELEEHWVADHDGGSSAEDGMLVLSLTSLPEETERCAGAGESKPCLLVSPALPSVAATQAQGCHVQFLPDGC